GPEPPSALSEALWWVWQAPADGTFEFNTHGSEVDTVLEIYQGESIDDLAVLASNDDDGDVVTSSATIDAAAGETYHIRIESKDRQPGLVDLTWNSSGTTAASDGSRSATIQGDLGLQSLPSGLFSSIPISTNTGEKPQSKV